ncbi:MotA/TolQ/ExbB proton channel family protein [soil metagenome]
MGTVQTATWIVLVEWLARLIFFLLIGLSVWSVRVILERQKFFGSLEKFANEAEQIRTALRTETDREDFGFLSKPWTEVRPIWDRAISSHGSDHSSPFVRALGRTSAVADPNAFEKVVSSSLLDMRKDWEVGLPVLGTLGATAPFIGLLGTVLGIIVSFGALASGSADTLKVMSSLAEALILTAVGLAVAIPAVIANNIFNRKILSLSRQIESLKELGMALRIRPSN